MQNEKLRKIIYSALFLALGMVLPIITGQIKEIGDTLLPMHLPVMLCGLICGYKYGFVVGLILPFARSLTFGMPPLYPNAIWMAVELATYGLVIGFIYNSREKHSNKHLFFSLICGMIAGRITWGIAKAILLGIGGKLFTIGAFITGGFIDSLPGIIVQLVLIPVIMTLIDSATIKTKRRRSK